MSWTLEYIALKPPSVALVLLNGLMSFIAQALSLFVLYRHVFMV